MVATVSPQGLVTGRRRGNATITATAGGKGGTAQLDVMLPAAQIEVLPNIDTLFTGDSTLWFISAVDSLGEAVFTRYVTWTVIDPAIVESRPIGADIWLKGKSVGVTWIKATVGGASDSARIWVRNRVGSVAITPDTATILVADTLRLGAIIRDTAGTLLTDRRVRWEVLRGSALIDSTGLLRALAGGTATIEARSETKADTAHFFFRVAGKFTLVTAGDLHTCGLTSVGATYCWGSGWYGQLGIGGGVEGNALGPALVIGAAVFSHVSGGYLHNCAVTSTGQAQCWGLDSYGALGNSSGVEPCTYGDLCRGTPLATTGAITFVRVSAGDRYTCGIDGSGTAYCWGANTLGELGIGSIDQNSHAAPEQVAGALSFDAITTGGGQTCALSSDRAYCWGYNAQGQLGLGVVGGTHTAPDSLAGGHRFLALTAGRYHTCGIATDSTAYCWGVNDTGQLGTGSTGAAASSPVAVTTGLKFVALAAGADHTCGIATDSLSYCWGANSGGQLGDGTTSAHYTPMPASGGLKFSVITANRNFTCGVTTSSAAYCWGGNGSGGGGDGRLGTDPQTPTTTPGRVLGQP